MSTAPVPQLLEVVTDVLLTKVASLRETSKPETLQMAPESIPTAADADRLS
jgi:hypothetical protein